jgi:hypothetical protein
VRQRIALAAWCLLAAPAIGWFFALIVIGSDKPGFVYVLVFVLLPAALALAAAVRLRAGPLSIVLLTVAAGGIGALTWLGTALYACASGACV